MMMMMLEEDDEERYQISSTWAETHRAEALFEDFVIIEILIEIAKKLIIISLKRRRTTTTKLDPTN